MSFEQNSGFPQPEKSAQGPPRGLRACCWSFLSEKRNEAVSTRYAADRVAYDLGRLRRRETRSEEGNKDVFVDFGAKISNKDRIQTEGGQLWLPPNIDVPIRILNWLSLTSNCLSFLCPSSRASFFLDPNLAPGLASCWISPLPSRLVLVPAFLSCHGFFALYGDV